MNETIFPKKPHVCELGGPSADDLYDGVLRRCDCGAWYVVRTGEWGRYWSRVRWYNFNLKKTIEESRIRLPND